MPRDSRRAPSAEYAEAFFDYSVTEIGVPQREAKILDEQLGILTVRQLAGCDEAVLRKQRGLGSTSVDRIMQCLANIGYPVEGKTPDLSSVPELPADNRPRYGMPAGEQFLPYVPG